MKTVSPNPFLLKYTPETGCQKVETKYMWRLEAQKQILISKCSAGNSNEVNIKWRQMHARNHWTGNISNGWRGWIKILFNYCQWKKRNLQCNSNWMQYWTSAQTNCRKKKNSFEPGFSILTNITKWPVQVGGHRFHLCEKVRKLGSFGKIWFFLGNLYSSSFCNKIVNWTSIIYIFRKLFNIVWII